MSITSDASIAADAMRADALLGAVLEPWRCDGTLISGRRCNKMLAMVDYARPMYVRVVCGRCDHSNTLVERYKGEDATSTC